MSTVANEKGQSNAPVRNRREELKGGHRTLQQLCWSCSFALLKIRGHPKITVAVGDGIPVDSKRLVWVQNLLKVVISARRGEGGVSLCRSGVKAVEERKKQNR